MAMKIIRGTSKSFIPASHEDPINPGVWKKVMVEKLDLVEGRVQMINWARMEVGQAFAPHYHEDMQEVFIILSGEVEITVAAETERLSAGDVVIIDIAQIHVMKNIGQVAVEYIALGVSTGKGGKTINIDTSQTDSEQ